jgi:hypothetical protein
MFTVEKFRRECFCDKVSVEMLKIKIICGNFKKCVAVGVVYKNMFVK